MKKMTRLEAAAIFARVAVLGGALLAPPPSGAANWQPSEDICKAAGNGYEIVNTRYPQTPLFKVQPRASDAYGTLFFSKDTPYYDGTAVSHRGEELSFRIIAGKQQCYVMRGFMNVRAFPFRAS